MREVKVKGLTIDNEDIEDGQWVYGYLCCPDEIIVWDEEKSVGTCYKVDRETVCQYIGRKDKKRTKEFPKGQEIYEGDKIRFLNALKSKDEYKKDPYTVTILKWNTTNLCFEGCWQGEIIGNIHDNKESIEAAK